MDQGSSASINHFSYQPGGYPPQPPGYSPYNAPPPGWTPASLQLADLGPRIVAYLIDGFLVGAVIGVVYLILFVIAMVVASGGDAAQQAGGALAVLAWLVIIPIYLVLLLFNEVYLCGKNNGQTIGKKLMKIRIVKEDGTSFTYMDAFLRNIVGYWISSLVCSLGFFWGLFDSKKQTWHDKIFHTLVVSAK
jgi:uncharacterized RDD family membrane protein YckC